MRLWIAILTVVLSFALLGPAQTGAKKGADTKAAPVKEPLDINSATFDQLKALPAIGDAIAKKILAGRPFRAKNEWVSKGIMTEAAYEKVKDMIIARQAAKK